MPYEPRNFADRPEVGNFLQAIGASLMGSPSNAPLAGFGAALGDIQDRQMKRDVLDADRQEKANERQSLELALRSQGFTAEQARAYSMSPSAANVAIQGQDYQRKLDLAETTRARDASFLSGLGAAASAAGPTPPADDTIPMTSGEGDTLVAGGAGGASTVPKG